MLRSNPYFPFQFCSIGAQVHDGASLVHIHTGPHIGIAIPEYLPVPGILSDFYLRICARFAHSKHSYVYPLL